jgi:hypothetical protein
MPRSRGLGVSPVRLIDVRSASRTYARVPVSSRSSSLSRNRPKAPEARSTGGTA